VNKRALSLSAVLALLVSSPACSYLFVTPPRENRQVRDESCTTNPLAPANDTLLASTNVVSALYVASEDNVRNKGAAVGIGLGVAASWISSAVYGFYNTDQCRELIEADADGPYSRPVPIRRRRSPDDPEPTIEPPDPAAARHRAPIAPPPPPVPAPAPIEPGPPPPIGD